MAEEQQLFRPEAVANRRRARGASMPTFPRRAVIRGGLLLCLPLAGLLAVLAAPQTVYREWPVSAENQAGSLRYRAQAGALDLRADAWCLAAETAEAGEPAHVRAAPGGVLLAFPKGPAAVHWDRLQAQLHANHFAAVLLPRLRAQPKTDSVRWRCAPSGS
jgi:hypothetical protein